MGQTHSEIRLLLKTIGGDQETVKYLRDGLEILQELGDRLRDLECNDGVVAIERGRVPAGFKLFPLLPLLLVSCAPVGLRKMGTRECEVRLERGRRYLVRRQYQEARNELEKVLSERPEDGRAVKEMAWLYHQERDYKRAIQWWAEASSLNPNDDEPVVRRWEAMIESAGDDSALLKSEQKAVLAEAEGLPKRLENEERALSLAYRGFRLAEADSERIVAVKSRLTAKFPLSETSYEAVGQEFYDGLYPIWQDDTLKVAYLTDFLHKYPKTEWRFTAYQYLLSSIYRLNEFKELRRVGETLVHEDPGNPFAYDYVAHLYLESDIETERALDYALRAIQLEPAHEKSPNLPEEQWRLEKKAIFGNSRFSCARALLNRGELEDAEKWIRAAIDSTGYGVNDYRSSGVYYYFLGQIQERGGREEDALLSYIRALIEADVRNRWTPKADSAFKRLYEARFGTLDGLMEYARKRVGYDGAVFVDVTEELGLGGMGASRGAWGDYDQDGYDDLLLAGSRLFKNVEGSEFVNVTDEAGISGGGSGGVWGDYNNDGFLDFYRIGSGESGDRLWRNRGDGTFADVTESVGAVTNDFPTEGAAWGDYDNDGFLDLYLANYEDWEKHEYWPDQLWRSRRGGSFSDVARQAGMEPPFGEDRAGRGANWGDYDNDGDLDCYVSNYRLQENFLWRNNGDGSFTNVACLLGVAGDEVEGWWGHTIGSEWGDYDNDGDLDLVAANLAHPRYIEFSNKTKLYENLGPPSWEFVDRREQAGIKFEETHSDPAWGDVDADGDLDLYITSVYEGRKSFLYENLRNGRFRDVTWLAGVRTFNGWGCAFSDYDRDGDLDLFVGSGSGVRLYRNEGSTGNWLEVKVVGSKSNRAGIGARVKVMQKGRAQIREVQGGKGTTSQHSLTAFFGFGEDSRPVSIEVRFPSGELQKRENVELNQILAVEE